MIHGTAAAGGCAGPLFALRRDLRERRPIKIAEMQRSDVGYKCVGGGTHLLEGRGGFLRRGFEVELRKFTDGRAGLGDVIEVE